MEQGLDEQTVAAKNDNASEVDSQLDVAIVDEGADLPEAWGSCHIYGSNNHLCKVKDVLYEVFPFSVSKCGPEESAIGRAFFMSSPEL